MRIEVKGRKVAVTDELRERVEKRFERVSRQVSPMAELEIELSEQPNPRVSGSQVADATLRLKGVTLRAHEAASTPTSAINKVADDLARQVKRQMEKRRGRREAPKPATAA
jgi:putative sigma-54 modulation protein